MMKNLSERAQATLINARGNRVGATIGVHTPAEVIVELKNAGMIGAMSGLTEYGVIARGALLAARLSAFGV